MVRGRIAFGLVAVAVAYSVALLVWVVAVPSIEGETLLEYGGPLSVAITAQPLVVSLLVWHLLHERCSTGSAWATRAAHLVVVAFAVWSLLGALSLAAGSFPAAFFLLLAAAVTPTPAARLAS